MRIILSVVFICLCGISYEIYIGITDLYIYSGLGAVNYYLCVVIIWVGAGVMLWFSINVLRVKAVITAEDRYKKSNK